MSIEIEGKKYAVVENLGFVHSAGCYAKAVKDGDEERIAVKTAGGWSWWHTEDRMGQGRRAEGVESKQ